VKANGYGHGSVMVARAALAAGAHQLAVATVDEGIYLRAAGIREPILVMGPIGDAECFAAVNSDLELTVTTVEEVNTVSAVTRVGPNARVHLKIDTGMRRYGCDPEQAVALAREIASNPRLTVAGTFTHLACADDPDSAVSEHQASQFNRVIEALRAVNLSTGLLHMANSAATLGSARYHYDAVRVGIALYGLQPDPTKGLPAGLAPALELRSKVSRVSTLSKGSGVSYGWTYRAMGEERIGLIPIGYGDGYPRALSSRGVMSILGYRVPVRGRVCMDQTVVGLPSETNISVGDDVVIVGDGNTAPSFDEIAVGLGTLSYELVTSIAKRVPRDYLRKGTIVAVEDLSGLHEFD
nr:alanine racemase [Chloroflexota bacterium]